MRRYENKQEHITLLELNHINQRYNLAKHLNQSINLNKALIKLDCNSNFGQTLNYCKSKEHFI